MRVISGSARSVPLKTVGDNTIRPTTDIIKETLFNILQFELDGISFLDLFAGSGAIGIEALSRGASFCFFVDSSDDAVAVIEENLKKTKLIDKAKIAKVDVRRIGKNSDIASYKYDMIFIDPPYESFLYDSALKVIKDNELLKNGGKVIIEMPIKKETDFIEKNGFEIIKIKEYKSNKHIFCKEK